MTILKILITNFKCHRKLQVDTGGDDMLISGRNGVGKTTIGDAILWLLTGTDLEGRNDYGIKPLDESNQEIHHLDVEVDGTFTHAHNSREIQLRRVYREQWTRKRGSAAPEFGGHTTDYYVDGVPKPKREYDDIVADNFGATHLYRLLADPAAFCSDSPRWTWRDRRTTLLNVCGSVPESALLQDPALDGLSDIIGGRTVEEHMTVIRANLKRLQQELREIPVRIDEAQRSVDIPPAPPEPRAAYSEVARECQSRMQRLGDRDEAQQRRRQIIDYEDQIQDYERADTRARELAITELRAQIRPVPAIGARIDLARSIDDAKESLEALRIIARQLLAESYSDSGNSAAACPTCLRPYQGQDLEDHTAREARAWNLR